MHTGCLVCYRCPCAVNPVSRPPFIRTAEAILYVCKKLKMSTSNISFVSPRYIGNDHTPSITGHSPLITGCHCVTRRPWYSTILTFVHGVLITQRITAGPLVVSTISPFRILEHGFVVPSAIVTRVSPEGVLR